MLKAMKYVPSTQKVYLDQPYAKIMWLADGNCLHVEWKAAPTEEGLNEVLFIQRHIIRTYGCTKVVVDNKGLKKRADATT
jgi:hypothetical protein